MTVSDDERLSRFLFSRSWFRPDKREVKPNAFIPPPDGALSVCCTDGLEENPVWQLGRATATARADHPTLYGRGDFVARSARAKNLRVERDDQPRRHATITGWPSDGKEAIRMKAVELAAEATLVLLPCQQDAE